MHHDERHPDTTVEEQADYWVVRRHSGTWSEAEREAFDTWMAESPVHRAAYRQVLARWRELDRYRLLQFKARTAARSYRPARQRPRLVTVTVSLVIGVAALGVLSIRAPWQPAASASYHTEKGERRTETLPDGSSITLNTDTELEVKLSGGRRTVRLKHGEALFTVARDPARPFEVLAAGARIRDRGTRFNVRVRTEGAIVTVLEGEVSVTIREHHETALRAGQRVSYMAGGTLSAVEAADVEAATAWRDGRLIFRETPLPEVLQELSRYHAVVFELADPGLARYTVTGSYRTDDLRLFLSTLKTTFPIGIEVVDPSHIRLSQRRAR